jgi:YfiH family protein
VAFVGRGKQRRRREILKLTTGIERPVAWLRQVHGAAHRQARAGCCGDGDALVTSRRDLALAISTADCLPIVLAGAGRIAAVHAGWRGLVAGVIETAVASLAAPRETATAWIGPAIGPCCYEVGPEVSDRIAATDGIGHRVVSERRSPRGRPHIDLTKAAELQLRSAGVTDIEIVAACTRCDPRLDSYRRDGDSAGRNLTFAWFLDGLRDIREL